MMMMLALTFESFRMNVTERSATKKLNHQAKIK